MKTRAKNFRKMAVFLSFFLLSVTAFSQVDTAFWFAVPKLTHSHAGRPIKLCISTFGEPATVTVTKPAANNAQVASFTVGANQSYAYQLVGGDQNNLSNIADFECNHNQISDLGLYIHSTTKVIAYISVMSNNSEIYALKGENGLGRAFFIPMQFQYVNANLYNDARNSVEIIATEDNTTVHIIPSKALYGGHAANQEIIVTLNKGQVYSFASSSQAANGHLEGTIVTSDKPIVVDVSDDSVTPNGSNQDLVADQIIPEELAGSQYIVVPSPSAAENTYNNSMSDYAFIFALEDGTDVEVRSSTNDSGFPYTTTNYNNLNRGAKKAYHFTSNRAVFIEATKPIFVFQLIGAGNELGGTLLPHTYCTGSEEVVYHPEPSVNGHTKHIYLTLLCNPSYTSGFEINNSTTYISNSDWKTVPGHVFKYCCKEITSLNTAQSIRIKNSLGKFHLGVVDWNGSYDDCSISYFSNYSSGSKLSWDTTLTHFDYCQGETINFMFDTIDVNNLRIVGPNDFEANEGDAFSIENVMPENSGEYVVIGHDSRACLNENFTDTIQITVHPTLESLVEATVCPGDPYIGNGFNITEDQTANPGLVEDSLTLQQTILGCDSIVRLKLTVSDFISSEFEATSCKEYEWNGQKYTASGDYIQHLESVAGCDSVVTLHLTIIEPSVTITSSNSDFCEYEETVLTAESDYDNYEWNTGETSPFITVTKPGLYKVTVTDETGLCQATTNYEIPACSFSMFFPNSISPSKPDGINDYLFIPEYVHRYIQDFEIQIFNRWGTCVFQSNDVNFIWSGEGTEVSQVYIYVIRFTNLDGKPFVRRGEITVL